MAWNENPVKHRAAASSHPSAHSADQATPEICGRCHQPLTWSSLTGGCPRCMMSLAALGEHDDALAAESQEVRRYSHFEIVLAADGSLDELGRGAMGTTYRALDTRLQSPVALKVISRNVAESAVLRARFLREARAAARLRHPNVASVFHYGEQEGECFYVMELVEGETLETRVRREGPLPTADVLEIGGQVARALSAAEAQGLVHRDIKPSNLMLATHHGESGEPDAPLVKIIDFGLAKAIGAEPWLGANHTRGHFVGTPAFASPEQFAKLADKPIDTRSDIYSLGVTLWYLLCGRVPYNGRTLEEVQARQGKFPVWQLADARVPGVVVALLRSMLAVDPSARPQSARDLLLALRRCQAQCAGRRAGRSRRAALAGLLVVLAVGAGAWWHHRPAPPAPQDKSIAVLPFENLSPEKADAFFTRGVQAEISENLGRVADLKVIDLTSTDFYLPGKRDLAQIGRELGVWHLLEGSLRREDGQVHVKIRLVDARDPAHGWTQRYDRLLTDVFAVQGEITHAVADRLGATLSAREKAAVDEPPTHDLAAYDLYLRANAGNDVVKTIAETSRYCRETEIPLLQAAVGRDPNFAFAYCRLGNAYDWLQRFDATAPAAERLGDYRSLAEAALAHASRLRPGAGEMHLAQAIHFLNGSHDIEQASVEVALARDTLPNSTAVETVSGEIARAQNHWEEALRCMERSLAFDPRNNNLRFNLAFVHYQMHHQDEFDGLMERIAASASDAGGLVSIRLFRALGGLEARADPAPMRAVLDGLTREEAQQQHVTREKYRLLLALYAHDADGIAGVLNASAEPRFMFDGVPYPRGWFEGFAARLRQDRAGARAAFSAARVEVDRALQIKPFDGRIWGLLGTIDAGLGNKENALREARHGCELTPLEQSADEAALTAADLAVVYAWTDQPELACAVLEEWINRPSDAYLPLRLSYGNLRLHPCWDPLRGNPRFEALVRRLSPKPKG